jgi:radical SAM protein with 4Fe4S-binding SPASM domain
MVKQKRFYTLARIFLDYQQRKIICSRLPTRLWIESTDMCNLKCIMCLNKSVPAEKKGFMDLELYKKIVDEVSGYAHDICLSHRGEPLMHPDIFEMIEYAKKKKLYVRLHTNATLLTEEKNRKLLESGLDLISFSFDGYDKETYEKIRVNANFDETLNNIANLLKMKREMKKKSPYTILEVIEFPEYAQEMNQMKQKKIEMKLDSMHIDEFIIKKLHNWGGDYSLKTGKNNPENYLPCTFPWYASVILWDGTVVPCPQDFLGNYQIGNVSNNMLSELWNNDKMSSLRKNMVNRDILDLKSCVNCDRLCRKTIFGIPAQYLIPFLLDNVGYNRLRKLIKSHER